MKNNNLVFWVLVAGCLLAGFLTGWTIREIESGNSNYIYSGGPVVRLHDTIRVPSVEYRIIPGVEYNVDSLIESVSNFWRDSLKGFYGKGLFEAKFVKEDNIGKREITLESRVPVDPEAEVTIDEELKLPEVYPVRRFGVYGNMGYENKSGIVGTVGVRYYVVDYRNFSLSGSAEGKYCIDNKAWEPRGRIEAEVRF